MDGRRERQALPGGINYRYLPVDQYNYIHYISYIPGGYLPIWAPGLGDKR